MHKALLHQFKQYSAINSQMPILWVKGTQKLIKHVYPHIYKLFWKSYYQAVKPSRQNSPGLNRGCLHIPTVGFISSLLCTHSHSSQVSVHSSHLKASTQAAHVCLHLLVCRIIARAALHSQSHLPSLLLLSWSVSSHFGSGPAQGWAQQAWKSSSMKWPAPSDQLSFILTSFLTSHACILFPLGLLLTKYLFALYPFGQQFS